MIIRTNFIDSVGYYAVAMNDHYNVVIHVQKNQVSMCGAGEINGAIHTDTNASSLWHVVNRNLADEMVKAFGARFYEKESYFDIPTQVMVFNL